MVKKILLTTLIVLLSGGLLGGWFWYVGRLEAKGRAEAQCRNVAVILLDSLESSIVDRQEMQRYITSIVKGQRTDTVDLHGIEQAVRARGEILDAEVYAADPHTIAVKIVQRKPVVRFEKGNEHFYSDPEGYLFPVSHSIDVPIVTGAIPFSPGPGYKGETPAESRSWVLGIVELARYIDSRNTLRSQIEQIDVAPNGDLVLYTAEDGPAIIFGDSAGYVEKFRKLEVWWRNIAPEAVTAEKQYKTINLKYNHQIICKQK
jgi:Cell division septal protein